MTDTLSKPAPRSSRPRVAAVVGLTLLEAIRHQDIPSEVLESEDPTVTMPRRLGLSSVIDHQIRRYRGEVKRGGRISDEEMQDLVRLVVRRPDSEEVFFKAGNVLAGERPQARWRRALPRPVAFALARRTVHRRLRRLFGRRIGGFGPGPFTMEGRALVFIQSGPGGDACLLLSGLCQSVLDRYLQGQVRVVHSLCEARRDALCRWTVLAEEKVREPERLPDFLLNPEPG